MLCLHLCLPHGTKNIEAHRTIFSYRFLTIIKTVPYFFRVLYGHYIKYLMVCLIYVVLYYDISLYQTSETMFIKHNSTVLQNNSASYNSIFNFIIVPNIIQYNPDIIFYCAQLVNSSEVITVPF